MRWCRKFVILLKGKLKGGSVFLYYFHCFGQHSGPTWAHNVDMSGLGCSKPLACLT